MTHAPNPVTSKLLATLLAATATSCASIPHPGEPSKLAAIRPVQTGPVAPPGAPADLLYADAANAILERDYGRALDLLQFAKQRDPKDIRVLNAFGVVYDKLGRFDLSARYYAQARALDPNSSIVVANLAYSQRLQRGEEGAARADVPTAMAATMPAAPTAAAVAPVPSVASQPAPVLAAEAEAKPPRPAEPLRRIVPVSAPAAVERVAPVRVALNPTPQSAILHPAPAEANAPRPSEPPRQIVRASAPAAVERARPVRVALVPPTPPVVIAPKAIPAPHPATVPPARAEVRDPRPFEPLHPIATVSAPAAVMRAKPIRIALNAPAPPALAAKAAPVTAVRAEAGRPRTPEATRQGATAVKAPAWQATSVAPKPALTAIATAPRAPAVAAAPAPVRTRALNVSLVIPPIVTQSRSSFWTRHSPLVLINASGSQSRVETVRTHLVRTGWSAPGWAVRQASRQKVTFIRYPASRRTTALALASTLPGPVRLSVCVNPCVGLQLVLGSDALRWNPMGRWLNRPRRG